MIDWTGVLNKTTQKAGWSIIDGPDSKVHESYWFGLDDSDITGTYARLNIVQGRASLVLVETQKENSNQVLWNGEVDKLASNPEFSEFVTEDLDPSTGPRI